MCVGDMCNIVTRRAAQTAHNHYPNGSGRSREHACGGGARNALSADTIVAVVVGAVGTRVQPIREVPLRSITPDTI